MAHLITGYAGVEHIQASDDGAFNTGVIGSGKYVFDTGNRFEYEIISNNLIKIKDGDLMNQGRHMRIPTGFVEECVIENGLQGVSRYDLIVMRYEKDVETGIESAPLVVIKGTSSTNPSDPSCVTGNIYDGEAKDDFPLYRVRIDNLNIVGVDCLFEITPSLESILRELKNHTHSYAGSLTAGGVAISAAKLNITEEVGSATNPVYFDANGVPVKTIHTLGASVPSDAKFTDTVYTHPDSGVTAGTYRSVSVDKHGHVKAGSNPTVTVEQGGTGATTAATARTNLGLGAAATKNVDTAAASGSGNLITSGAMYNALAGKAASSHSHSSYSGKFTAGSFYTNDLYQFNGAGCLCTDEADSAVFISASGDAVTSLGTDGSYRFGSTAMQPGKDNTLPLGSTNYRWKQLCAGTTSIATSDRRLKDNITPLSDIHLQFFMKLIPVSFTFIDGDSGRTHIGFISQDVEQAMMELGMTSLDFAGFCRDVKTRVVLEERVKLDEKGNVILDEDGNPVTYFVDKEVPDFDEDGNEQYIYSLRYSEFIGLITHALQFTISRQDKTEERIAKLEEKIG